MAAFAYPAIHDFPPFYTQQPNVDTWRKQRQLWCDLVLSYYRANKLTVLDVNEALTSGKSGLFVNATIKRSLPRETVHAVIEELVRMGNAEWEGPSNQRAIIYWRRLEEWASMIWQWAFNTGQTNSICTLYEIAHGDATTTQEFHALDEFVVRKALLVLVKQGKAQMFSGTSDSDLGVKFFLT
ncbi:hypothetical protein SeMB42_g02006 [Synchytrium endobioticum]|uniref:Vacuolar protein-sorting-associated protein 25 n=1 Tax=Synchytrium endobioticum TaxID=286115 RepID=A0A507CZY2_9FUNG|nr:hypothetical protein SeLEV6574_g04298 [Synchytrium endobioticum]TPX51219.1 hypothetical protein SeMB42_g02006 [Synchytrium endobioticum]